MRGQRAHVRVRGLLEEGRRKRHGGGGDAKLTGSQSGRIEV